MQTAIDPALVAVAAYDHARAITEAAIEVYRLAVEAGDFKDAEAKFGEANAAMFTAFEGALKTAPTTSAGAVALLRLLAENLSDLADDPDQHPTIVAAVRAAADAIEVRS